jgi:predicted peptidase
VTDEFRFPSTSTSTSDSLSRLQAIVKPRGYSYLISRPAATVADSARGWPAILFLHGAGERGSRVDDVARQGIPKLIQATAELSPAERAVGEEIASRFVVIAPQCPTFEIWNELELLRLLDDVLSEHAIDPARLYLTGMSMGAFGAWTLALRYPRRFAAFVPICGGGRLADITAAISANEAAVRSLGIWAFHGARDRVVPFEESERMVDELKRVGIAGAKLTVYPNTEHDAWSQTYSNPELYRWLLEHKR